MADNDGDSDEARTLRPLQAAPCTYRIAFGPRAGQQVLTLQGAERGQGTAPAGGPVPREGLALASASAACKAVHRLGRRLAAKRCKRPEDSDSSPFRWSAEQGYGDRLRARVFRTDGCGATPRVNPSMTPGKTLFGWAVHPQQTSPCIQRQVQGLRALYPTVVLPLFCRVRGAVGKEKGRLKSLSSLGLAASLRIL